MKVNENESVVFFDIDGTLVCSVDPTLDKLGESAIQIRDPYDGNTVCRMIHKPHLKLLKNYVARGFKVFVWSKNGYQWAAQVLNALGIDHLDLEVMTKPRVIIDDEPPINWIGEQVNMPFESSFGRD